MHSGVTGMKSQQMLIVCGAPGHTDLHLFIPFNLNEHNASSTQVLMMIVCGAPGHTDLHLFIPFYPSMSSMLPQHKYLV